MITVPRTVLKDASQTEQRILHNFSDSDFAGCSRTAKSACRRYNATTSRIEILQFSRGLPLPGRPARADGWAGTQFSVFCFLFRICLICFLGVYRPWELSNFSRRTISCGMHSKSCLGMPWGRRYDQFCRTCVFSRGRFG